MDGADGLSITWKGAFVPGASYQVNDAVADHGQAYIAIADNSDADVSDATHWSLLAARGADGAIGPIGPAGPAGADGATGPIGPAGADGATGPVGPAGADGAVGPAGPVGPMGPGITFQGAYNAANTPYHLNDVVTSGGSTFVATGDATADPSVDLTNWSLMAAKGADGATGPMGPAGADGAPGPMGPMGPMGPAGADGAPGPVGPAGPAGPVGPDGPMGAAGPAGPVGTQGPIGPQGPAGSSGLAAFGHNFELATLADATVVGGADVPFSDNGPLFNITHSAGDTTIQVPLTGKYKITFSASYTAGQGADLAIAVNSTVDPSTLVDLVSPNGNVTGVAILSLSALDVLTLRNNSATPVTLAESPFVGASIVVEKLD